MCTLELPLKPHIKKYILRKLQSKEELVELSFNDIIGFGLLVSSQLVKKSESYMTSRNADMDKYVSDIIDSTIKIELKSYHGKYQGAYLNNDKIFYINKHLDRVFRLEMFTFINTQMLYYPHIVITTAIDDFFAIYGIIEDDFPRQTAFKIYQRYKNLYTYLEKKQISR